MVRRCASGAIARGAAKRAVVREHARAMLGAGARNLEAIGEVGGFRCLEKCLELSGEGVDIPER